jgi:tRNA(Ile)-lysidine synthase
MRRPPAVARVLERVTRTAREHDLLRPGELVLAAVSGGPDSVCLLYALWHLRRLFRVRLAAFHFDHRLRTASAADAAYVRRMSDRLRVPFHLVVASDAPPRGASIEAWARDRRRMAASYVANDVGASAIATAHTLDDQAETVLAWALMGGGVRSIRPRADRYVRPLLDVPRVDVEAFCRALGLRPRRDETNQDLRFLRNAIRLRGIPALERATGRSVREPLARTASLVAEDDRELSRQSDAAYADVAATSGEWLRLDAARLTALRPAIARRVVGRAIFASGAPATQADVEAVLDLAAGRPGRRRDLAAGLKARREREYVVLSRASPESRV